MVTKKQLHELVDRLDDGDVVHALDYLRRLVNDDQETLTGEGWEQSHEAEEAR